MSVDKQPIEIVPWVFFNTPEAKKEVLIMAKNADSMMNLASELKTKFKMSLSDASIVAKKFYKK